METASQIRYVTYYERLLRRGLRYPEEVWLRVREINITGVSRVGKGDGSDLSLEVRMGRTGEPVYTYQVVVSMEKLTEFVSPSNIFLYISTSFLVAWAPSVAATASTAKRMMERERAETGADTTGRATVCRYTFQGVRRYFERSIFLYFRNGFFQDFVFALQFVEQGIGDLLETVDSSCLGWEKNRNVKCYKAIQVLFLLDYCVTLVKRSRFELLERALQCEELQVQWFF